MENTQGIYTAATYTPEEASNHLNDAKVTGIEADAIAEDKGQLKPLIEQARAPMESDKATADMIRSNRSLASVVKPDNDKYKESGSLLNDLGLNFLSGTWDKTKTHINLNTLSAEKSQITGKLFKTDKLSKMDRLRLLEIEEQEEELSKRTGLQSDMLSMDYVSGIATSIIPTVIDSFTASTREPIAAAAGTAPAVIASLPSANPLVIGTAAVTGFLTTGTLTASAVDTYNRSSNDVMYDLFKYRQTPEGAALSRSQAATISRGVGVAAAALDTLSLKGSLKAGAKVANILQLKKLGTNLAKASLGKAVEASAVERTLGKVIMALGKSSAHEGGTEVLQSLIGLIGEEMGKTVTETSREVDVMKAIANVGQTYASEIDYLAKNGTLPEGSKLRGNITEFAIGAGAGSATTAGSAAVIRGAQQGSKATSAVAKKLRERRGTQPSVAEQTKIDVAARNDTRQLPNPDQPKVHSATQALTLSTVIKTIQERTGDTKLAELQPETHRELIANQFKEAGIDGVWVDPTRMQEWAGKDEKKLAAVARLFEGQFRNDIDNNTVFKADPSLAIELTQEFPDAPDELFQAEPQALTWKQYQDMSNEMKARQKALLDKAPRYEDKGLFPDIKTVEQGQALLKELRAGLTDLQKGDDYEGKAQAIAAQQGTINDLLGRIDVLPFAREAEGGTQMSFEDAYDRKKNREAQDIVIDPTATDEQIVEILQDQETAQAYLNRIDRNMVNALAEEGERTPIYHGTRGPEFDRLDPSRSGGMIFFGEDQDVANRYAQGAGGGRYSSDSDLIIRNNFNPNEKLELNPETKKWEGVWEGQEVSFSNEKVNALIQDYEVSTESKSARIVESAYDPKKVLDVTSSEENQNKLREILKTLKENKTAQRIASDKNINAVFWSMSKYSSRNEEIRADFQNISDTLKAEGYEGIRFKDDQHITVALFAEPQSKVQQFQTMRDRVEAILPTLPTELQGLDVAEQNFQRDLPPDSIAAEFLKEEPMPAMLENALPETERKKINQFYNEAKQAYNEAVRDEATAELQQVRSVIQEAARTVERDQIREELRNDPDLKVVDSFFEGVNVTEEDADKIYGIKKKKARQSVFAVDPDTMTALQRENYLENEKLDARKFFRKGGMTLNEAAEALGVDTGDRLLEIMANKGTTEETIDIIASQREAEIEAEVKETTPLNETAIIKAYESRDRFHKSLLDSFKTDGWGTFKKVLRRVTDSSRSSEMIRREAEFATDHTKIKDLNVKKYERGEVQSRRKGLNAAVKGDLQEAYDQTMNAIHNNEMQRAQSLAIGKTNRNVDKLAKYFTTRVQAQLAAAGENYVNAVNEFMDVLNLSPYAKGESKAGSYAKLAETNVERGLGDARIPDHILNEIDTRLPWNEMTVAQLDYVVNSLETLLKQARDKNKAFAEYKAQQRAQTQEMIQDAIALEATAHPDYDPKRTDIAERASRKELTPAERAADFVDNFISTSIDTIETTARQLDRNKDGLFTDLIWNTIAGRGNKKGPYGVDARAAMISQIGETFATALKEYGTKKFSLMGAEKVTVSQFEANKKLNFGKLRKSDIFMMALHAGNDSNFDTLTNYDVSKETFREVFEEHLTEDDMKMVQRIFDITKSFESRVIALEKLDGRDVEIIPPTPFVHKGKTYPGGWFHIEIKDSERMQRKEREKFNGKSFTESTDVDTTPFTIGMTKRGFTKDRVGTSALINLDVETIAYTFDMIATDLTMRIPIRETGKILTDKKNKEHIINVIGKNQYSNLLESIYGLTMTPEARGIKNRLESQVWLERVVDKVESLEAVMSIGGNIASVFMQPLSLGNAIEKMGGVKAIPHFTKVLAKAALPWNFTQTPAFYEFARSIDPTIEKSNKQVDDFYLGGVLPLLPRKGNKIGTMYSWFLNWAQQASMRPLALADIQSKSWTAIAAYSQYMAGEAPGTNKAEILSMAPEDRRAKAREYGRMISSTALTQSGDAHKSQMQKSALGKRITRYFNDIRQTINTRLASQREVKWNIKEAVKYAKDGDFYDAAVRIDDASGQVMNIVTVTVAMAAYESLIRSQFGSGRDDEEEQPIGTKVLKDAALSRLFPGLPVLRDAMFAADMGRPMTVPVLNVGSRLINATTGLFRIGKNVMIEGLTVAEAVADLNKDQQRGLLSVMSMVSGGLPVNGPYKMATALIDQDAKYVDPERAVIGGIAAFAKTLTDFAKRFTSSSNEKLNEMGKGLEEVVKDMGHPETAQVQYDGITPDVLSYIRAAENPSGKWDIVNSESGAFGNYQMTLPTWRLIVSKAPASLGLTMEGLYDRDGKQVERGLIWQLQEDVNALIRSGFEPTLANIYGLHHFGRADWLKILKAAPKTSKYVVTTENARKQNEWLRSPKIKQAKDIREWIAGYIGRAKARVDKKRS